MSHPAFELKRQQSIPALKIDFQEYEHKETGARHIHLASEDNNNAFLVAFRTVPEDSTGVAHILEHTSLCGSKRYPVRDPFFMMTRRSLSTFMNAFTASDWTAYPFATQSRKDFDNLLGVYLDATFFPNLDKLDFLQEGHRVEFEEEGNQDSPLEYKGIVFNEMKGAMSSPVQRIWQDMQSALFPSNTYHYNSGGEPVNIPELSHQELKDFHARHYHPSNALLMTYGNFPVDEHQAKFDELALKGFKRQSLDIHIPDEKRLSAPINAESHFALDDTDANDAQSHLVLGWLLGSAKDLNASMDAQMLASALLDNSASPLRKALETTDLGTAPSDLCGFEESMSEGVFVCGLEGCRDEDAPAIESMILSVLEDVAENGVPQSQLDSILHQIELSQREAGGGHFPYGLQLMVKSLTPALHGADPFAVLDIDPILERLREQVKNPDYIPHLARQLLLDNPHRVTLLAQPDTKLVAKQATDERAKLDKMAATLTSDQKQTIVDLTEKLKARQESEDDPELLPSVAVEDAPKDLSIPTYQKITVGKHAASFYPTASNGLVYQQLIISLSNIDEDLLEDLPLFCDCLNEVGINDLDYMQTQELQASISGGVSARLSVRSPLNDLQSTDAYMIIAGKALYRNLQAFSELLKSTFANARFDELDRLRELIAQMKAHRESNITQAGHRLAMQAATAGTSPYANLSHQWDGLVGVQRIIALDAEVKDDAALIALTDRFKRIQKLVIEAPRQFLLVNEEENLTAIEKTLSDLWDTESQQVQSSQFNWPFTAQKVNEAWTTSTQVNFCARAYLTVPSGHQDAAALTVLGHFLRNGYLHRTIREQGGAYGGGAAYAADTGAFRFYSYRDPRFAETLSDFDQSLTWLQTAEHEQRTVDEAILGVVSDIDRPDSPAGEAIASWYGELHGRDAARRREFRQQVMAVTLQDLKRVANEWLKPGTAHTAVITDPATLEAYNNENPSLKLDARPLK